MELQALLLLLLSSGFCVSEEEVCSKTSQIDGCDDCIRSGPFCVWCKQLGFLKDGEQELVRCDSRQKLRDRGCDEENIITVNNNEQVTKKKPLTKSTQSVQDPVQLYPQEMNLKLRPGLPQTFTVRFRRAEGYPVDLYYLMDLSFSMNDDLKNVKKLGNELFNALRGITEQGRIGFGAFVDKTVLPFTNTNPEKLRHPCDKGFPDCQPAFGYHHVLDLTDREEDFRQEVQKQSISGNLDPPEGSLDAMMQATVCGDVIGWRNSSTRLLVLTTDAGFHMAGDGRLAGILVPNDEQCHLISNAYMQSSLMDYPSVGQLALQLEKHNVQPIFAVTEDVYSIYKDLSKMIPKSEVGILTKDSSNVVKLITEAYNKLSSKVTLTHSVLPDDLTVTFDPHCEHPGPQGQSSGVCDKVVQGTEISFSVTVEAHSCSVNHSFSISPLGIKDTLRISVEGNCGCSCNDQTEGASHSYCTNQGHVHCGVCRCFEGFLGQFCNCSSDQKAQTASCRSDTDDAEVCNGRGDCVCGRCQCYAKTSGKFYSGAFCECDDEDCPRDSNKICGGNGECKCRKCHCRPGYDGDACECETSVESCRTEDSVCNGRGSCQCNKCKCQSGYQPPFCEKCPSCPNPCQGKLSCIECQAFDIGPLKKSCLSNCSSVSVQMVENLPPGGGTHCELKDSEGCWVRYQLRQLTGRDRYSAIVLQDRDCPPSVTAIVAAAVASVALLGLLLLLLVKLLIHLNDLKEFRKFENEKKKSRWAEADNPLFQNATTTVPNPTYTGE